MAMTVPTDRILHRELCRLLTDHPCYSTRIIRIERLVNPNLGANWSEIVECQLQSGRVVRVLCKYPVPSSTSTLKTASNPAVNYIEANVYSQILVPLGIVSPVFVGVAKTKDLSWLVFEYLEDAVRADRSLAQSVVMERAARWLGSFHARAENLTGTSAARFLPAVDGQYVARWAHRTLKFAEVTGRAERWLTSAASRYIDRVDDLDGRRLTVMHGDLYASNVLEVGDVVHVIDWAMASWGPGEIDLASLTERWPREIAKICEQAYVDARWPHGAPVDFSQALNIARVYLLFRWMGESMEFFKHPRRQWRFESLRSLCEESGLIY